MQVSSAPSQPSALDTWLHQSESPESASLQVARGAAPTTGQAPGAPVRDTAEGLLDLDVWGTAAHRLMTAAPAPDVGAQQWATHIFAPLA